MPHPRPLFMRLTVPAHHMSIRVMMEAWQPRLHARCGPVSSPPASTLSPASLFAIRQPEELSSSTEQIISCCPCLGTRSTPPSWPTARGPAPVSPFNLISHRASANCVLVNAQEFVGGWRLTMIGVFTPEKSTNVKNHFPLPQSWLTSTLLTLAQRVAPS